MNFLLRNSASLLGVFLALALVGCAGGTPDPVDTSKATDAATMKSSSQLEISDSRLEQIQFKTLWTNHNLGGRIEQAWFSGSDIYATTRDESDNFYLTRINGESGLPDWRWSLKGRLEFAPTAYSYENTGQKKEPELFVIQDDTIYCLYANRGSVAYKFECKFALSTPVSVGIDHFYVGSFNHRVYCYAKQGQRLMWSHITGAPVTAAATAAGVDVCFGSEDGNMYYLNGAAGFVSDKSWQRSSGGRIVASALFYNGLIFYGSQDYKVYCRNLYQGQPKWREICPGPVLAPLFPYREQIFAISEEDGSGESGRTHLLALSRTEGKRNWKVSDVQRVVAADGFHCYALDNENNVKALRHEDGKAAWTLETSNFDFILSQDADQGRARERLGRIYLLSRQGFIQAIQPRR